MNPVNHNNNMIKLIDTHFNVDMYLKETRYSGLPSFIWKAEEDAELQLLITNYCFLTTAQLAIDIVTPNTELGNIKV